MCCIKEADRFWRGVYWSRYTAGGAWVSRAGDF